MDVGVGRKEGRIRIKFIWNLNLVGLHFSAG